MPWCVAHRLYIVFQHIVHMYVCIGVCVCVCAGYVCHPHNLLFVQNFYHKIHYMRRARGVAVDSSSSFNWE